MGDVIDLKPKQNNKEREEKAFSCALFNCIKKYAEANISPSNDVKEVLDRYIQFRTASEKEAMGTGVILGLMMIKMIEVNNCMSCEKIGEEHETTH